MYQNEAYLIRKKALRETIQMLQELEAKRENSVFLSKVGRFNANEEPI
jgi:hypothetical protein